MRTCVFPGRAALAALLFTLGATAHAASYSAVFVYGDSLSDNGNLYHAVGYPPAPYYDGRFSNGPVAVEQLAAQLNAPLYDFAYGGATSGVGNILDGGTQASSGVLGLPGLLAELGGATVPPALISSSLFVVWGGANDFEIGGDVNAAIANIDYIVQTLESEGATNILVPGIPDLGLTPEYYGSVAATAYTDAFNAGLQASLPAGAIYVDTDSLFNSILADPSAYGLTNTTAACFNGITVCSDPDSYLFWDDIHPTTVVDTYLADEFAAALNPVAPTPEPSSFLLLGTGFAGVCALARKRRLA